MSAELGIQMENEENMSLQKGIRTIRVPPKRGQIKAKIMEEIAVMVQMENGGNKSPQKGIRTIRAPRKRGQIKAKIMEEIVKSIMEAIFSNEDGEGGGGRSSAASKA
ncbi:hypothetical protein BVC80_1835g613 [Macleaya cordata]|uniref:Uncharacterized protein n=1 Tax=Macleaya cordata TaxID=56857 RepID=A0A200R635_MACCD|nr:hypothetical protein BVC80_1835g613 [Macleaya cordata]